MELNWNSDWRAQHILRVMEQKDGQSLAFDGILQQPRGLGELTSTLGDSRKIFFFFFLYLCL